MADNVRENNQLERFIQNYKRKEKDRPTFKGAIDAIKIKPKTMKLSIKKGFSFGLISGIITTLGLIVGLHSGTNSNKVIIGSILVIAVADAMSDALGVHVSEESDSKNSQKEVWESTIATFLSKFVFALSFVIPILAFQLQTAIFVCITWGLGLIAIFSHYIAKLQKIKPYKVITEHLTIAVIVIVATHYIGKWISHI